MEELSGSFIHYYNLISPRNGKTTVLPFPVVRIIFTFNFESNKIKVKRVTMIGYC